MEVLVDQPISETGDRWIAIVSERREGDLAVTLPAAVVELRRRAVLDRPWVWLQQVHGARTVVADDLTTTGSRADAVLTARAGLALAVHTADCGPVALVGRQTGVVGAVHVGWRGLVAGVLPSALDRFSALGEHDVAAVVGPSICAAHYEFGEAELADVVAAVGSEVAATTPEGRPALDLRAGIRHELVRRGVDVLSVSTRCTAEEPGALYSHRARRDTGRQALVVRREVAP